MSQAIQHNSQVMMTRHPKFLRTAEALRPALSRQAHPPIAVVEAHADAAALFGWRAEPVSTLAAFYQRELTSGDSVIIDFGSHYVGYLHFLCQSAGSPPDAPAHLQLTFGETLSEVCEPFSDYQGWLSSSWLQQHDEYIDVIPSTIQLSRRYCFRYLKITVVSLSPKYQLRLTDVTFETVSSAPESHPACDTRDAQLRRIDEISVLTLRNCMQEVFEDGPKRDRRLWLGDLRLQALVNNVTFKNHDLVRRCLYLFSGHRREDGMVSANIFTRPHVIADDTFLFDYSLFYVDILNDYVLETQDVATAKELWPIALRQIELALDRCDTDGLVTDSSDWWSFIDWHENLNNQGPSQRVLIYCLHKAIQLAQICQPELCERLSATLSRLMAGARRLWDPARGLYVSGAERQISYATQIWMVLADIGDGAHQRTVMENLLHSSPEIGMNTPYMRHHFIAALLKTGMRERAIEEIKKYWGKMVEYGVDTFWELFDPEHPDFSPYGSKLINSYCHAWSCTPSWFIRQYGL